MAIDRDDAFTIQNYLRSGQERDTSRDGVRVPFFFGALRNNPPALRRILEAVLAAINWETTLVSAGVSYSVTSDDAVILAGSSSANTIITLPVVTDGRILVFKDKDGLANTNLIKINAQGSTTIEGSSTTFELNANFGAVIFVGVDDSAVSKWFIMAIV